ncbi:class I SAM-dependent methyltransferase [Gordonia sp. TBRC 11910]|uniref:Class I SAM-dependent methyltransferase n=1 Tax=Gordonia asplenii TaxID=2725283 RepID=A0A848KT84_9ACTN|nr:class I SAM-dependent methyltransferase [Gordonia asplenii]NMO01207.1 class I SAM-dependent methyltransferase [Gordonia asplenii]
MPPDDLSDLFVRAHSGLPRQAPGSAATTELLLRLAGRLPRQPRILDIGSGPGSASITLAQLTGGTVTAVDTHQPFLDEVTRRAADAGVDGRIVTLNAPMQDLPLDDGSVDLIWAEGAVYLMGFDAALTSWRRLLSDDGVVVLTEAEWSTPQPSHEVRRFWGAAYPAMRRTGENVDAAQLAGYDVRAVYVLPDSDWAEYYDPLTRRIEQLRTEGIDEAMLAVLGEEITIRSAHGADYSYTGYVLRRRAG